MRRPYLFAPLALAASLALGACAAESDSTTSASTPPASATAATAAAGSTTAGVTSPAGPAPSAGATSASTSTAAACSPATLKTYAKGKLTVATDSPAYEPWFSANKPTNGKGFESAVAYAVAQQLGFPSAQVTWTKASFNTVIAPTPKKFDFDVNEVSITAARAKAVDFSSGYYDVAQAVVTLDKDKLAAATSIAGLKSFKLGAQQGTTSYDAITDTIKPTKKAMEYPTNDLAVQALKNGQIDGLVVDLPTGLYLTAAELTGAKIVGQVAATGTPEQFGLVLGKGSALTGCVSRAVDALKANGTLAALSKKWLTTSAGAPVLK